VLVRERRRTAHRAWSWVGALATAALLLVALATPMSAALSKTQLSNAVVSPRNGTTSTTIIITVVYQNQDASRAEQVTASVGESAFPMTRLPGGDWGHGVTFRWSGTLSVGTNTVSLKARAKDHSEATLAAGTVTITVVPTPTPKPTPNPTPRPTPRPTPKPIPAATPRATPRPTARPTATPALAPTASPSPASDAAAPSDGPSEPPVTAAIIGEISGGTGPGGTSPRGAEGPRGADGPTGVLGPAGAEGPIGQGGGNPTGGPGGRGLFASVLAITGLEGPILPGLGLGPTLVTTTGAVAAAMAFGLFGRRRRDDDLPDEVLAAAAATGFGVAPLRLVGASSEAAVGAEDIEALMPRWRRPSLLQARKADPIRDSAPAARLTFDQGLVGPLDGRERRVIRYRVVRLLDSPDELRGAEIGYLDQGDEVQLLEKYGAYWLVQSPDGQQGWLHKMTLGEIVDADGPARDGPVATMPIAADSWTMGEADADSDVFDAYLESRRREA